MTLLGPTFKLWDWVLAISPYWHVPSPTGAGTTWWGLAWIRLVTAGFLVIGFAGFGRRDTRALRHWIPARPFPPARMIGP